ncbi:MAG: hypothetical protein OSB09_08410, partial [Planctomycetota bacterium]|nr:hypothetical protein [Planctomycetota bacterium]
VFFLAVFFLAVFFLAVFFAGLRFAVFFAAFFFAMSNSYRGHRPKTLMLTPPSEGATVEENWSNRCSFSSSVRTRGKYVWGICADASTILSASNVRAANIDVIDAINFIEKERS